METLAVGIPTIVNPERLQRTLDTLHSQQGVLIRLYLVCNGPTVRMEGKKWARFGTRVHFPLENMGVAGSWNWMCQAAWGDRHDSLLLLNDDVQFTVPCALEYLSLMRREHPGAVLLHEPLEWWAFSIPRAVWEQVGPFDDGFWPAYVEDWDYERRCRLLDVPLHSLNLGFKHEFGGSKKSDPELEQLIKRSRALVHARYQVKWGGTKGEEQNVRPWGGKSPVGSTKAMMKAAGWL